MKKLICLLSILFILFSCKKETKADFNKEYPPRIYDTIKPLPYFPVYPGSYWKYAVTVSVTIPYSNPLTYNIYSTNETYSTSSTYRKDSYIIHNTPPVNDIYSDTVLVPFYNEIPIWGYLNHFYRYQNSLQNRFVRIVSDSLAVGASWFEYNEFSGYTNLSIRTKDTNLVLNGQVYSPVIIVRSKKEEYGGGDGPYSGISDLYYAKNIGLIKTITVYTSNEQRYQLKESHLIEYHINK